MPFDLDQRGPVTKACLPNSDIVHVFIA